ncbi:hypothetical protein [Hymenobacter norwichensis]|uniref:hypothetical protein n=1 Tax=Hymenobacter norwichensis TaxID=223903 RepID=UPI0003B66D18|nr:hypothetical protein [Hymenobacter norwichensis]
MAQAHKRKAFLSVFLGALGAVDLVWGDAYFNKIYGAVLYAVKDVEEQQAFVWHMTEQEVPSPEVTMLVRYVTQHGLLNFDKLSRPLSEIAKIIEVRKREKAVRDLFAVDVKMLDDGVETDSYFMHE